MSTMNVLAIATEDKYTAAIVYDDDPGYDPRDLDDLGTMVCWHRHYKLGDNNPFKTPQDFFHAKITDLCSRDEIFDYALKAEGSVKIEKCKNGYGDNAYELFYYGYKSWLGERHEPEWQREDIYADDAMLIDAIVDNMSVSDCKTLLENKLVMLPLYLYDHSGITMSVNDFGDKWDSGQVGWIYADYSKIKKEYGVETVTETEIQKTVNTLKTEIETYDRYLRGEVYGIMIYEFDEVTDSCFGYFEDIDYMSAEAASFLPVELRKIIIAKLRSCHHVGEIDMDNYFAKVFNKEVKWSVK